jgi:uncharacterized membrane protein
MIQNWFLNGLGAAVCFACMVLAYKKLLLMGIKPLMLNFFLFGLVFVGFFVWNMIEKNSFKAITPNMILFLAIAAFFSLLGNYLDVNSVKSAPNPGYSATLKSGQIILVALLSPFLFDSSLSLASFTGIGLVILGIFLIGK